MNPLIAEELARIPRGGFSQNVYRSIYEQSRLNALARHPEIGPDPADAPAVALKTVRESHPDFVPTVLA